MFSAPICFQAERVLEAYRGAGKRIVTAESCTGGLIAACLTGIAGSSHVFERGFVTYSNDAKRELLGVGKDDLAEHGAVSAAVASAMAAGALSRSHADTAISVTGVAGPGGGTADKPVGLVFFGLARLGEPPRTERCVFDGDREAVRLASVSHAVDMLAAAIRSG